MTLRDDDTAKEIINQQRADARPTREEQEEAARQRENMQETVYDLMKEGAQQNLIERVVVYQKSVAQPQPNSLEDVAQHIGGDLLEDYEEYVADKKPSFLAPGVEGAAKEAGIPITEEN